MVKRADSASEILLILGHVVENYSFLRDCTHFEPEESEELPVFEDRMRALLSQQLKSSENADRDENLPGWLGFISSEELRKQALRDLRCQTLVVVECYNCFCPYPLGNISDEVKRDLDCSTKWFRLSLWQISAHSMCLGMTQLTSLCQLGRRNWGLF